MASWPPPSDDSEVGPSSETAEQLTLAPGWPSRRARTALIALGLVVAVVVALLVERKAASHSAAAPSPPARPTESAAGEPSLSGMSLDDAAVHCPVGLHCRPEETVPAATDAAVTQYLPGAVTRRRLTIFASDAARQQPTGLYYRAVNATSGLVEVLVVVTLRDAPRPPGTLVADPHPGAWIRYVRRQVGRFEVQVQFTGPPGHTPPVARAVGLARDPRLLASG